MLGLAKKAGKVSSGEFLTTKAVKSGSAKLVIVALDASSNTRKAVTDSCKHYKVPYIEYGDREGLGRFTGGGDRVVVSVNDHQFAQAITRKLGETAEREDR